MALELSEVLSVLANRTGHAAVNSELKAIITGWEEQRIVISGTPTGGTYTITCKDGNGTTQTTGALAHNADGAAVQAAVRLLSGFEFVTVATSGVSPNFTHDFDFVGVGGPIPQMTSTSSLTGGAPVITHSTQVEGTYSFAGIFLNLIQQLAIQFATDDQMQTRIGLQVLGRIAAAAQELASNFPRV